MSPRQSAGYSVAQGGGSADPQERDEGTEEGDLCRRRALIAEMFDYQKQARAIYSMVS